MAYDIVDYIEIPEEFEEVPDFLIASYAQSAFDMAINVLPYETGNLINSTGFEVLDDSICLFVDGAPYIVYLEEDIAKTAGCWSEFCAIFETAFLGALEGDIYAITEAYRYAMDMINTEQYGTTYKTKLALGQVPYINMGMIGG
jgi:hypothetical protein